MIDFEHIKRLAKNNPDCPMYFTPAEILEIIEIKEKSIDLDSLTDDDILQAFNAISDVAIPMDLIYFCDMENCFKATGEAIEFLREIGKILKEKS